MMRTRWIVTGLMLALLSSAAYAEAPENIEALVPHRMEEILDAAEESNDFRTARDEAEALFEQVVLYAPPHRAAPFRDALYLRRLTRQLFEVPLSGRRELLGYLRENEDLARTLVMLIKDEEDPAAVYGVLEDLRAEHGDILNRYANLTAAVCVVHDRQIVHRVNENSTESPGALPIFEYYSEHERDMNYGIRGMPAELLVFVVDSAVSLEEMQWARQRYAGHQQVGALFNEIEYDYDHQRRGQPKRSTEAGWGLPNILQYGGVCADQAYFSVAVGKAIGVPAVYTSARSGTSGHAWVGFLEQRGRRGAWNFNYGRFGAYEALKGNVKDPQTGRTLSDSTVALLAAMIGSSRQDRHDTAAYVAAARRLVAAHDDSGQALEAEPPREGTEPVREPKVEDIEQLLERGLRSYGAYAPLWQLVSDMAEAGMMNVRSKRTWGGRLEKLCGDRYPDFTVAIYIPMIQSIEDVEEQNDFWEALFRSFSHRPELGAEIRALQGEMWREEGEITKAGMCYEDVISRFANGGPFVLEALEQTEQLLIDAEREDRVLELYQQAWLRTEQPGQTSPEFFTQSNWFNIGKRLVQKLREADRPMVAARIVNELETASGMSID